MNDTMIEAMSQFEIPHPILRRHRRHGALVGHGLPTMGLIVAWGPPKCGKSFWGTSNNAGFDA
jgi:hypothetical protein